MNRKVGPLNIWMAPDYLKFNPYLVLLSRALEKKGARVRFFNFNSILFINKIDFSQTVVFHFHWLHSVYRGGIHLVYCGKTKAFFRFFLFFAQLFLLYLMNYKLVWTVHNLDAHENLGLKHEILFNRLIAALMSQLIVHNQFAVMEVSRAYQVPISKIRVVPHGSYADAYATRISREAARAQLNLSGRQTVFLVHGILEPYKGIEKLIEMWGAVAFSTDLLLIVGKANQAYENLLREKIRCCSNISFKNKFIPDSEVHRYYSATDVVVFCYRKIFASGSFYLALNYDKPIIAPKIAFFEEVLKSYPELLYEQDSLNDFKRAVSSFRFMDREKYVGPVVAPWDLVASETFLAYGEKLHENQSTQIKR